MIREPNPQLDGADPPSVPKASQYEPTGRNRIVIIRPVDETEGLLSANGQTYGTTSPKKPARKVRKRQINPKMSKNILYIVGLLITSAILAFCMYGVYGLVMHDYFRLKWAAEEKHRAVIREEWAIEMRNHEDLQLQLHKEIAALEGQMADMEVIWSSERAAMDEERRGWSAERKEQMEWLGKGRQDLAREREEQAQRLMKERQDWAREREEQERILEEERRADEERRQAERRAKERKEQQEKEEEDRKRDAIAWTGLEVGHCVHHGVREYTATISEVPVGFDSVKECWKKPIGIHGREWLPNRCEPEDLCPSGKVTGHWEINSVEATCRPYWDSFNDKGCLAPGIRRYNAHLMNVQDMANWEAVCITAPADINGRHYDGPNSCESWTLQGIWGVWDVQDDTCR